MKLYCQRSNGEYKKLSDFATKENAEYMIRNFLMAYNYQSYYTRSWEDERGTIYDVGSHTEFFVLTNKDLSKGD